jgi:hypothetical protein
MRPFRLPSIESRDANSAPRLVRQFSAFFLVTQEGEVWRIFDADSEGIDRSPPSAERQRPARLFVGGPNGDEVRIYRFSSAHARSLDARGLEEQLGASLPCAGE